MFDLSGSMKDKLAKSREALVQFLRGANPEDEFCLVEFSNRARLTVPFTTDTGEIRDRLRHAEPHGRTALLDAVDLAMDSMKHARYARRALLILSDGGDNDSRYTQTEMLQARARGRSVDLRDGDLRSQHGDSAGGNSACAAESVGSSGGGERRPALRGGVGGGASGGCRPDRVWSCAISTFLGTGRGMPGAMASIIACR